MNKRKVETKFICNICNVWVQNNPMSKSIHETGTKHIEKKELIIKNSRNEEMGRRRDVEETETILRMITEKAEREMGIVRPKNSINEFIADKKERQLDIIQSKLVKQEKVIKPILEFSPDVYTKDVPRDEITGYGDWNTVAEEELIEPIYYIEEDDKHIKNEINGPVSVYLEEKTQHIKKTLKRKGLSDHELDTLFQELSSPGSILSPAPLATTIDNQEKREKIVFAINKRHKKKAPM